MDLGHLIGTGGFAKVFKCKYDGQAAVCKCISAGKLDDETVYLLQNECTIWSRLVHPHIVNFFGMASTSTGLWLLCEYMPDGSLCEALERKQEAKRKEQWEAELRKKTGVDGFAVRCREIEPSPSAAATSPTSAAPAPTCTCT